MLKDNDMKRILITLAISIITFAIGIWPIGLIALGYSIYLSIKLLMKKAKEK